MMHDRLSDERISEVSTKFNNVFRTWATTREIFDVVYVQSDEDAQNDDFAKIGINQILDRNFFTEQKGSTYYDHTGIGLGYGKNIALGEVRYVLNIMVDCKDVIKLNKEKFTNYLHKFINGNSDIKDLVILMSPVNKTTFWGDNKFTYADRKSLWGFINDIPMYWTPIMPRDKFYIFKKNMGKIIVKTDARIDISEISPSEYDSIIENIPTMTKDKLKNYVRVKANEVIKFRTRTLEIPKPHARADGCYCKKCGASINPSDEKCPEGHILKEVGKHFVVSAEEKIGISAEAKIDITREEELILKRLANRVMESMGAVSLTIKLPFIDITFDKHEQDITA